MAGTQTEDSGSAPKLEARRQRDRDERQARVAKLWAEYRLRPGDDARNALVEAYQSLAHEMARRFAQRLPRSVDRGDLLTAASVGLIGAIAGFDPTRGVRFETYCERRVKGALLDELRNQDWLPRPWRARQERHKRVVERLRSEHGRDPADEEIARAMELAFDEYLTFFGTGMPGAPTGGSKDDDGSHPGRGGLDVVADPSQDREDQRLTHAELLTLVAQRLTEQEYRVLYLRYWEGLPMREIGLLTGSSESRVCKLHARLIERLRERFRVGVND